MRCWWARKLSFYLIAPFVVTRSAARIGALLVLGLALRAFVRESLGLVGDPWSYRFFPIELPLFLWGALAFKAYNALEVRGLPPRALGAAAGRRGADRALAARGRERAADRARRPSSCERRRCDTVGRRGPVSRPPRCTALITLPAPPDLDPAGALERLRSAGAPWLLESALPVRGSGGYSFAGADPYLILRARGLELEIECRRAAFEGLAPGATRERGPALAALRARLPAAPPESSELPFCGGAVGVFGYELAEQLDVHALHGADDLALPDAVWLFVDALVAFDHERGEVSIAGLGIGHDAATARARAQHAAHSLAQRLSRPAEKRGRTPFPEKGS